MTALTSCILAAGQGKRMHRRCPRCCSRWPAARCSRTCSTAAPARARARAADPRRLRPRRRARARRACGATRSVRWVHCRPSSSAPATPCSRRCRAFRTTTWCWCCTATCRCCRADTLRALLAAAGPRSVALLTARTRRSRRATAASCATARGQRAAHRRGARCERARNGASARSTPACWPRRRALLQALARAPQAAQRAARVLPHRHRRAWPCANGCASRPCARRPMRRGAGRQRQAAAGRARGRIPPRRARAADAGGRDADRSGAHRLRGAVDRAAATWCIDVERRARGPGAARRRRAHRPQLRAQRRRDRRAAPWCTPTACSSDAQIGERLPDRPVRAHAPRNDAAPTACISAISSRSRTARSARGSKVEPPELRRRRDGRQPASTSAPARSPATTTAPTSGATEIGDGAFIGSGRDAGGAGDDRRRRDHRRRLDHHAGCAGRQAHAGAQRAR